MGVSKITDKVYIGDQRDAKRNRNRFTIFTVAIECTFKGDYYVPIVDGLDRRNVGQLRKAVDILDQLTSMNGRVLVHCVGGASRSPIVVAGYLMRRGMSIDKALTYIKHRREAVDPNPDLVELLRSEIVQAQSSL